MASRLQDVILRGLAAGKPLATAVAPGTLYYSTDLSTTERSDGTIWQSYSGAGGGGGGTLPTADIGHVLISQGAGETPIFSPKIILMDPANSPGFRRWEIKVVGDELQFDSQNDAGVSYNRPIRVSIWNGTVSSNGNFLTDSGFTGAHYAFYSRALSLAPTVAQVGTLITVTDSTVNTPGAVIAGGGTFNVLARWNGTNWIVVSG